MKITITYEYSHLDKEHCFGIYADHADIWTQWIWFHLGRLGLNQEKYRIYPFMVGKTIATYTTSGSADIKAAAIFKKIEKVYQKKSAK